MSRRLLTAGLTLVAVLAGRAAAKPPELPLPQNDVLAPQTSPVAVEENRTAPPDRVSPEAAPAPEPPLFFRVRPSVRRTMASCLLFGANPLLALAPTEEFVDFDEEDGVPQAAFLELFDAAASRLTNTGSLLLRLGQNRGVAPAGAVKYITLDMAIALASHEEARSSQQLFPRQVAESDQPTPSACPWMREQQCVPAYRVLSSSDVDLSHDVLDNLEMLRQAHDLLQDARELGRAGRVAEALDCLQLAQDLCPTVWLDEKVQEASAEVFTSSFVHEAQAEAPPASSDSVSLQPCLPPVDPRVSVELDDLYPEESPAAVLKGVAKPFAKAADLNEVSCGKDDGALIPASFDGPVEPDGPMSPGENPPDDASAD